MAGTLPTPCFATCGHARDAGTTRTAACRAPRHRLHVGRYPRGVPAGTHMPEDCATSRLSRAELLQRVLPVAEAIPGAAQERSVLALPGCNCAASARGTDLHRLVLADLSHLDRTSAYELQHERRLKPAPGQQQHGLPSPRQRDVEQSSFLGELERLSHWHRQRQEWVVLDRPRALTQAGWGAWLAKTLAKRLRSCRCSSSLRPMRSSV